jgi:hypothetical protein|tara:strand:- start:10 stop:351 length:342 start_codon:yes stop_codon:yes gene_type:complete
MAISNTYTIEGAVADGVTISERMPTIYERGYISVLFFSDAAMTTSVIPSAGTITILASEDGLRYGTVTNGDIDVSVDPYERPNWSGQVAYISSDMSGVTGATHYRLSIHRFSG